MRRIVRKGQSRKARESIERLFDEPFEPRWMKWQRETKEQQQTEDRAAEVCSWMKKLKEYYRRESKANVSLILSRVDSHGNYHN